MAFCLGSLDAEVRRQGLGRQNALPGPISAPAQALPKAPPWDRHRLLRPPPQQSVWDCGNHREVARVDTGRAVTLKARG